MSHKVYKELQSLATESRNPDTVELDRMSPLEVVQAMNRADKTVAEAVEQALPDIAAAAETAAGSFRTGGWLVYVGAGTSGRLGVLDASECPPTFGVHRKMVIGIIAGGYEALRRSIEGAEDDESAARAEIGALHVDDKDTVCGITASRRTPYVAAALEEAKASGAKTIFLCCNEVREKPDFADIVINPVTGPEILTGSTRLKAGTATKMVLNMITTTAMVLIGKTYKNMMVDLQPWSEKLRARSRLILKQEFALNYEQADALLSNAKGELKTAIIMQLFDLTYDEARARLNASGGRIRGS